MSNPQLQQLLDSFEARLATVESTLGLKGGAGGGGGSATSTSTSSSAAAAEPEVPFVTAFDNAIALQVVPFVEACNKLGGGANKLGDITSKAWNAQRDFLVMASKCKKPSQEVLMTKIDPFKTAMGDAKAAIGRDEWEGHAKTVSEGLACLSWVLMAPPAGLPADTVTSAIGGSDYWANKIRTLHKKTNPDQVAFCDTFKGILTGLEQYVKEYHKTGVSWNFKGGDVATYDKTGSAGGSSGGGGGGGALAAAPAPAPPAASAPPAVGGLANVFSGINKGLNVTAGLKKVTKDQQTWRQEYKGGEAPPVAAPVAKASPSLAANKDKPTGQPKKQFLNAGNKWEVEYQGADQGVVEVEVTNIKHQVYIYGCVGATVNIKGKCKMVAIDNCKKCVITVEDALSSIEMVNCQRLKIKVTGSVPSIAIDKSDGVHVTLSEEGMKNALFTTSKSSEMNVAFPVPSHDEEGEKDILELPIPEQFVHTVKLEGSSGKPEVTSNVSDLYTH